LAGVRFPGALEAALRLRWNTGILPGLAGMPVFRLPIPVNPDPPPVRPGVLAGVNIAGMFADPRPIDVAMWIQGLGALPCIEKGNLVSPRNFRLITAMMQGDAMLYMVVLN
jgi:hypothetical protein